MKIKVSFYNENNQWFCVPHKTGFCTVELLTGQGNYMKDALLNFKELNKYKFDEVRNYAGFITTMEVEV